MKKLVLALICVLIAITPSFAKIYKVKTPEEFNRAAESVQPGDQLQIANGNYSSWELALRFNGTAKNPIIVRAETAGKVIFSGSVKKAVFLVTGNYIEISGLTFSECELVKADGSTGVLIDLKSPQHCRITECVFTKNIVKAQFMAIVIFSGNAAYNRIDHCRFTGNIDNQEVQVKVTANEMATYTTIDHNVFQEKAKVSWANNNGGECVQVGQDPILLGAKSSYATVNNNRFIHCDGEPEVISNKCSDNKYLANYFENCKGELVMRGGHDCVIDGNTFKGGSGGIRINGTHHTVINNKLQDLPSGIRLMYGMAKGKTDTGFYIAASDCVIKNNTISNCNTGIFIGDSKNVDWTGKFDTARYPSRTMQDVAPFGNTVSNNKITGAKNALVNNNE